MKKLLLILALALSANAWAEGLTLECKGKVEVSEVGVTTFFGQASGSGIYTQEKQKDAFIIFSMDKSEKEGWVQLSNSLLIVKYSFGHRLFLYINFLS